MYSSRLRFIALHSPNICLASLGLGMNILDRCRSARDAESGEVEVHLFEVFQ